MDYETCLEVVNLLETIKKSKLKDSPLAHTLAKFMCDMNLCDTKHLDNLAQALLASVKSPDDRMSELTADVLITSDFLADKIRPWVETVREELFHATKPPFATLIEAEQWMESQSKFPTKEDFTKIYKAQMALEELKLYEGHPFRMNAIMRSFSYLGTNGRYKIVYIREPAPQDWGVPQMREEASKYAPFNWLENETRIMARATGFTQLSLVQFVLVGTQPLLPRYVATGYGNYQALPSGEVMQPVRIDVEIRSKDLTFEELRRIYNDYRRILPLKKNKMLNRGHWEVYQLVGEMGPPPGKGTVAYWESVRQRWNESHKGQKDRQYATWKGMQKAYDRIIQKLNKGGTPWENA